MEAMVEASNVTNIYVRGTTNRVGSVGGKLYDIQRHVLVLGEMFLDEASPEKSQIAPRLRN